MIIDAPLPTNAQMRKLIRESPAASGGVNHSQPLLEYMVESERNYAPTKLARAICASLELVIEYIESGGKRGIQYLYIGVRRRGGKTTGVKGCGRRLIDRFPTMNIMITSKEDALASNISRDIKDGIVHTIRHDTKSKRMWELAAYPGGVISRTVGSGGTGWGWELLIIDDLVKDMRHGRQQAFMDEIWERLDSSILNAANNLYVAPIILIGTRYSKIDPIARMLERYPFQQLVIPSVVYEPYEVVLDTVDGRKVKVWEQEPGTSCDPRVVSYDELMKIQNRISPQQWAAMEMQEPIESVGGYFMAEWLEPISRESVPVMERLVRGWDLAASGALGADYTAGVLLGVGVDGHVYVLDAVRARKDWGEVAAFLKEVISGDPPETVQVIEKAGVLNKAIEELHTDRDLMKYALFEKAVSGKKEERALPLQGRFSGGRAHIVQGGWNNAYIDELCAFTLEAKGHDDFVDASSLAYNELSYWEHDIDYIGGGAW